MLHLFEEVKEKQYMWKLFFLVNGIIPTEESVVSVKTVDDIRITKTMSSGYGICLKEEEDLLTKCKNVRIFTREIELALLSDDREMFLYSSKDGEDVDIRQIGIVDKYVYISDKEVASPVHIEDGEGYTDAYFRELKKYVLHDEAEFDDFRICYRDKTFTMTYEGEELCKIENAGKNLSYPFVLYLLVRLSEREPETGFESKLNVTKIRKKE